MPQGSSHRVVVIVDADSNPFELGCATEVFGLRRPEIGRELYDFRLCAPDPRIVMRDGFFTLTGVADLDAADDADTLIVPNRPNVETPRRPDVLDAIRRAHARGARLLGFCSGAFTLAEAGVLNGRRATAHWQHTAQLAARHPQVIVDDSVLYTEEGSVLTSAGATAALDLCLHLVRQDLGAAVAGQLARRLVVPAHRTGGQAQFIEAPLPPSDDDSLGPVLQWAVEQLATPLTVDDLARRARMSTRTFHRRLQETCGTTPLQWLLQQRIARAQTLLERTDLPVERIGEQSGLGTAANLRRHFSRAVGVSPTDYRRAFRPSARPSTGR